PGAPDPPEVICATKDSITIAWKAPHKAGTSKILGYMVQKRKKGTITWLPVNTGPVAGEWEQPGGPEPGHLGAGAAQDLRTSHLCLFPPGLLSCLLCPLQPGPFQPNPLIESQNESGLEGSTRIRQSQPPCHAQGHPTLEQAAHSLCQPGQKHLQGSGPKHLPAGATHSSLSPLSCSTTSSSPPASISPPPALLHSPHSWHSLTPSKVPPQLSCSPLQVLQGHNKVTMRLQLNTRGNFLPVWVPEQWHRLPREVVEPPCVEPLQTLSGCVAVLVISPCPAWAEAHHTLLCSLADKKMKVPNLKKGLQYEFRVAAVNAAGLGDASDPSQPAWAQDATKRPGQVQELRVSSSDSSSVTLTWKKPQVQDGNDVKGYEVEVRPSQSLTWTKCSPGTPIQATSYRVKGLQANQSYSLRVRALSDSGLGEAAELEASTGDGPREVPPRLLIDGRVSSTLVVRAGNSIRVKIPFEASPDPVVTWLKDGLPLPKRATTDTKDGTTQLLVGAAEFSDSGTYTVELQNSLGKRETFSFQVQITGTSPTALCAVKVPGTVTVTWEPSASEKWERNLFYTVLKRESEKGSWHVVGDLIYTNKFTFTKVIPGRDYYFRVLAKNALGVSGPAETLQPWSILRPKAQFEVKAPRYRGVNQNQPPRILVPLKPHVVPTGSECHMSCAVGGHPQPKVTWYKDNRDLSTDPAYFCTNDFGVCSLVVLGVSKQDEGEYMVEATNACGRAYSRAFLTIKGKC
ncbi:IGFN1 protein, partial [Psilopogon haemacephalus]|nr:IGFN1 protein [Psilopogon haemacephalus]